MPNEPTNTPRKLTFDEELLLWLGDETPQVRAADSEREHGSRQKRRQTVRLSEGELGT